MPKYDFNKVALQLYWNHTSALMFSWMLHIFRTTFPKNTSAHGASYDPLNVLYKMYKLSLLKSLTCLSNNCKTKCQTIDGARILIKKLKMQLKYFSLCGTGAIFSSESGKVLFIIHPWRYENFRTVYYPTIASVTFSKLYIWYQIAQSITYYRVILPNYIIILSYNTIKQNRKASVQIKTPYKII